MKYVVVIYIFQYFQYFWDILVFSAFVPTLGRIYTITLIHIYIYTVICLFALYSQYLWGKDLKNSSNPTEKSSLYYQGLRSAPLLCGFSNGLERSGSYTFGQRRCKRDRQCFCWDLILGLLTVYVYIYNNNPSKPRTIYH